MQKSPGDMEVHERFMREALTLAESAFEHDETPVGCVFVHNGEIIGKGTNETNKTMNGTRHAEFVAMNQILSQHPSNIFRQTDLYVTVEPAGTDPAYPVYGDIFRGEAIMLLRRFYVQENDKAPDPKQKKTRELKTEILPLEMPQKS